MSDAPVPAGEFAEVAGDPGEAAELPATTGRDPHTDTPDTEFDEQDGDAA